MCIINMKLDRAELVQVIGGMFGVYHHSSSRLARWKHMTVQTNMKKDVNSISMAPV